MKKIIVSTIILIIIFKYIVPPYYELNNIKIIDTIKVEKINNQYNITLREIIPTKNNNTIKYKYKYHKITTDNLKSIKTKKLYLSKVKFLITNINPNIIINTYNIKPKKIIIQ